MTYSVREWGGLNRWTAQLLTEGFSDTLERRRNIAKDDVCTLLNVKVLMSSELKTKGMRS